jgi:hypothetical protein
MSNDKFFNPSVLLAGILSGLFGFGIGCEINNKTLFDLEKQAIDRGYAKYVVVSKSINKFTWIEKESEK